MGAPAKILLADDQSLYREGLAELFKKWETDFSVVADVSDGAAAIEASAAFDPDIVLMDVKMPGVDGIDACREISASFPDTAVVMLSLYGDKGRVLAAISNGARGYLLKNIRAVQLHDKLITVLRGGVALSDEVGAICFEALRGPRLMPINSEKTADLIASLTEHEKDLLRFVARGSSNRDIADSLYLGESTVKKQISFLLTKLDMSNRVQAAVFALRSGIAQ